MIVRGENLEKLYLCLQNTYRDHVGSLFTFRPGEMGRTKNIFTYVSEAMGIRDEGRFEEVLEAFEKYIDKKTKEWLSWEHRSRKNYMGFMEKKEEISVFISGLQSKSEGVEIAGTGDEGEWEF